MECADNLERLRDLGYNVPQYAIDALRTQITEDRMDIVEQLRATPETGADPDMIFEAAALIEHLRCTVSKLAALAQHSDGCSWITPLPTGQGYWGCDCGLNDLVLDGEPTDAALTPNDAERTR